MNPQPMQYCFRFSLLLWCSILCQKVSVLTAAELPPKLETNVQLTGGLNQVKSGATFTLKTGATFLIESGVTFSLPWADVNKTGSSLADLATRSASDLNSGTLPAGRLPTATTSALGGVKVDGTTITIDGSGIIHSGNGGTVTHTGGALTNLAMMFGAGSNDSQVAAGLTTDGISRLQLGVAGTSVGGVEFRNATSGTVSLVPQTGALGTAILTIPAATDTLATLAGFQVFTNKTLGSGTSVTAAITFTAGVKQVFKPDSTSAGLNTGALAGDPFSLANGDLWYNSSLDRLQARIGGVTVSLGAATSGTVTHTGGDLTSNAVLLGAGVNDSKVVAGITSDGTSKLVLGVAGTSVGGIDFKNATSGTLTLQPVTGALGTVTLLLPAVSDTLVGAAATQTLTNKSIAGSQLTGAYTSAGMTMATSRLLGRTTASSGAVEEISIGSGLSLSSGSLTATGSGGTVTNTGGSLTNNFLMLGAGSNDSKVVAGISSDGTSKMILGVAGTSVGAIDFKNATSGTVTLQPVTGALGTVTLLLPAISDTLVGAAATQTLTNKSIAGSQITGAYTSAGMTMATSRLLGRTTASSGAAEEISIGSGLTLSSGTLSASGGSSTSSIDPDSLIERFRNGINSAELFTLTNGVNEIDLWYDSGTYYFCYDNKTEGKFRSASTIAGLSSATDSTPVANGRYPKFYFDGTTWHVWVWIQASNITKHYTSSSFAGTYTFSDSFSSNFAAIAVRKMPDGFYYAAYEDLNVSPKRIGLFKSSSLSGSWTDLGHIFSNVGSAYPQASEEADPGLFTFGGRVFCTYAAYDGSSQRCAIAELDPSTMKAIYPGTILVNPLETWQQRNSQNKVQSPVFLSVPTEPGRERIYYSQNVNTSGTASGWAYIEADELLNSGRRRKNQWIGLDTWRVMNLATGMPFTLHGTGTRGYSGITATTSTGGAYGEMPVDAIGDFTLTIDFTANSLPTSGNFALLCRISTNNSAVSPLFGLWIRNNSGTIKLYSELHNNANTSSYNTDWTTTITTGTRYRATIRKLGSAVVLYLNGAQETSGTHSGTCSGFQEWAICNQKGVTNAASQQFDGTINAAFMTGEALPLSQL